MCDVRPWIWLALAVIKYRVITFCWMPTCMKWRCCVVIFYQVRLLLLWLIFSLFAPFFYIYYLKYSKVYINCKHVWNMSKFLHSNQTTNKQTHDKIKIFKTKLVWFYINFKIVSPSSDEYSLLVRGVLSKFSVKIDSCSFDWYFTPLSLISRPLSWISKNKLICKNKVYMDLTCSMYTIQIPSLLKRLKFNWIIITLYQEFLTCFPVHIRHYMTAYSYNKTIHNEKFCSWKINHNQLIIKKIVQYIFLQHTVCFQNLFP